MGAAPDRQDDAAKAGLHADHPKARRIVVCLESKRRITDDGIEVWPVKVFIDELPTLFTP